MNSSMEGRGFREFDTYLTVETADLTRVSVTGVVFSKLPWQHNVLD